MVGLRQGVFLKPIVIIVCNIFSSSSAVISIYGRQAKCPFVICYLFKNQEFYRYVSNLVPQRTRNEAELYAFLPFAPAQMKHNVLAKTSWL